MRVVVPDGSGRVIEVLTDDPIKASQKAKEWAQENPAVERGAQLGQEDVSAFGDVLRGVGAGLVGAAEGITTLPIEIIDSITSSDENSAQVVREFFNRYKPETSTGIGEASKFITQFAVPGGAAYRAARGLSGAGKVGAIAGADIAATTPDVETIGDFLDAGPTKRINLEDLEGAELAQATLANRLKVAAEGAAVVFGVPAAARIGVQGIRSGAEALGRTDVVKEAARSIPFLKADPETAFKTAAPKAEIEDPSFLQAKVEGLKKLGTRYLTNQGRLPDEFSAGYEQARLQAVSAANSGARQAVEKLDNALSFINKNEGLFNSQNKSTILNAFNDYLFPESKGGLSREAVKQRAENILKSVDETIAAQKPKTFFGKNKDLSLFQGAQQVRASIDDLSKNIQDIRRDELLDPLQQQGIIQRIGDNLGFYGRRLYRASNETNYQPNAEQRRAAIDELKRQQLQLNPEKPLSDSMANSILNDTLIKMGNNNANVSPKDLFDDSTLSGIAQGLLKGRRLDNLPAVRDFLGEYTGARDVIGRVDTKIIRARDVGEQETGLKTKIVETVDQMAKSVAKSNYYKNLSEHNKSLPAGAKYFYDEPPVDGKIYKRVGDKAPDAPVTEEDIVRFGPLAGKYVLPEHLEAFENAGQVFNLANTIPLYATFLGMKGMSQVMKTVYSPITQIRNATTAAFYLLQNGNLPSSDSLAKGVSSVLTNINQRLSRVGDFDITTGTGKIISSQNATKADLERFYNEKVDLGVVNTNAKIGEFESLLNDAVDAKQAMPGVAKKAFQFVKNQQNNFAAKLYQGSDDVWKISSHELELGKLQKVFKNNVNARLPVSDSNNYLTLEKLNLGPVFSKAQLNQLSDNVLIDAFKRTDPKGFTLNLDEFAKLNKEKKVDFLTEAILKREAAEIVKDTVPNYARVPEAIKRLRQLPLGNFIAFPAEIIRTSGNVLQRAIKELASESPELREIGMKRLTGMMATTAAIPSTLMAAGTALTGADSDQVQAYKRSMAYEWDRNSTLIPIATDKDGNITEMYNFSYTNPYDYMMRPARAVYNAVANGITSEKDLSEIAFDASSDSLYEFAAPFTSESIITQKIFDINRNKTDFGAPIYNEADPLGLKFAKGVAHFAEGLTPGGSPVELTGDVGSPIYFNLKFGDFPKAIGSVAGMDPRSAVTRQGYRIDPAQEFAEALTGLKTIKPRVKRTLYYRGVEAARNVRDASAIFNQVAKSRGDVSAEKVTQAYITANEQRFKALRDLNMAIEDAKTLGLSTSEIVKPLREAKTPKISSLLSGRFNAFFPTKETIGIAMRGTEDKLTNPFNFDEIRNAYRGFQGAALRPQAAADAQAAQAPVSSPPTQPQPAPPIAPTQPSTPPMSLFDRGIDALRQVELNKLLGID